MVLTVATALTFPVGAGRHQRHDQVVHVAVQPTLLARLQADAEVLHRVAGLRRRAECVTVGQSITKGSIRTLHKLKNGQKGSLKPNQIRQIFTDIVAGKLAESRRAVSDSTALPGAIRSTVRLEQEQERNTFGVFT